MAHDKEKSDETETDFAATGTDGAPRPPSLNARLANVAASSADSAPDKADSDKAGSDKAGSDKSSAKPTDSATRRAELAKGTLPPPLPGSAPKTGAAPPPLPPTTSPKASEQAKSAGPKPPKLDGKSRSNTKDAVKAKDAARQDDDKVETKSTGKARSAPPSKVPELTAFLPKVPAKNGADPKPAASPPSDAKSAARPQPPPTPPASPTLPTGKAGQSAAKDANHLKAPTLSFFAKLNAEEHRNLIAAAPAMPLPSLDEVDDETDPQPSAETNTQGPSETHEPAQPAAPADEGPARAARSARREARRRPAGPVRERLAANDDAPSIGGLIYALQQKPSNKPYQYAAIGSVVWAILGAFALWLVLSTEPDPFLALLQKPVTFLMLTAVVVPIMIFWFLALLAARSEELRLRSSTMAEVAIRLAEPDRLAEQSTASLGQAVRRQVGFMNDAVSRALGRAGELEALVHNEVSALERSYDENERKIRGLIQELSGERNALLTTSEDVHATLKSLGSEVPDLIEKLSSQQLKLAQIIEGAGENLTLLETSLSQGARQIESSIGNRTEQLQSVLENYTGAVDGALQARTEQMHTMLTDHTRTLGTTLSETTSHIDKSLGGHGSEVRALLETHTGEMGKTLSDTTGQMQGMLETYTGALAEALANRTEEMQEAFEGYMLTLDTSISNRTDNLQSVFEAYAHALDTTLASRAQALDSQLVARTRALDDAFNDRLRLFDETIVRTTSAIDEAVGEKAVALTSALDSHAKNFRDTLTRQTADIDDTLTNGISAVRRSSENVTRQSLKAIEGLASQSDLLKRVSENLLGQINSVTNRFENQGQLIMQAANALESANYKIDSALKQRHSELSGTLDRLSHKADEFSQFIEGYSTTIEDQLTVAQSKAKATAEELRQGAHTHQRETLADLERFTSEAGEHSQRALADLRKRFSNVSEEVTSQFGNLNSRIDETSGEVRQRAQEAARMIEEEHARLQEKLQDIPNASHESAEAMRRSLQDQLKALDQLSSITRKQARNRDISEPAQQHSSVPAQITADPSSLRASYDRESNHNDRSSTERQLSSLSSSLARELHSRPLRTSGQPNLDTQHPASAPGQRAAPNTAGQHPATAPTRPQAAPAGATAPGESGRRPPQARMAQPQGDGWSLGDLLKRASLDEESGGGSNSAASGAGHQQPAGAPNGGPLPDVSIMVQAIDPATANEIWERLRSGQRGILVPSLYPPNARIAFDELSRRYRNEAPLRDSIGRFLSDFEHQVRTAEKNDPTGRHVQSHLLSDMGRAYLFLAHVSGRFDG